MNQFEKYKDIVLSEYAKGNIVYLDIEGTKTIPLKDFVSQPIEGILYDLNRLEENIIVDVLESQKWINDYALVKLERHLYEENQEIKKRLDSIIDKLKNVHPT